MNLPAIHGIRFVRTDVGADAAGPLGFVSFRWGWLRIDGLVLRRKANGRLTLSYPSRRDRSGKDHPYLRPINDEARRRIESEVFSALGLEEGV